MVSYTVKSQRKDALEYKPEYCPCILHISRPRIEAAALIRDTAIIPDGRVVVALEIDAATITKEEEEIHVAVQSSGCVEYQSYFEQSSGQRSRSR